MVKPFLIRTVMSVQASTGFQLQMDVTSWKRGKGEETVTRKPGNYENVVNHISLCELPPFLGLWI